MRCALLGYFATQRGNSVSTFWDNLSAPKRRYGITTPRYIMSRKGAKVAHVAAGV